MCIRDRYQRRVHGNLSIKQGAECRLHAGQDITLSLNNTDQYDYAVFEILSYSKLDIETKAEKIIQPDPRDVNDIEAEIIYESIVGCSDDIIADHFADSQEPLVLWCAGLRTLQMLTKTRLSEANIKMIIDSSPSKQGQIFCGHEVHKPEDLNGYDGKILLLHASCPEKIKEQIQKSGIRNEIIVAQKIQSRGT
eukprot:TRINITY_DN3510_c0_g1_i1.p1 TRINITY_DN3510_c0_g1~~TRINITY_DN3510_c0_g1_i1.p1  ORF type:complete len:202 (+),score=38.68 TRINITY_DN3510_c0_g1_i1:27-608(+)